MTSRSRRSVRPLRTAAVIAGLSLLAVVAACGGSDDAANDTTTSSTTSTTSTSTTSTTEDTAPAATTPDGGLEGAALTQVSVPYAEIETAQLTDVTVGAHEGYDRVVFTFDGELPGYDIGYVDGPVTQDGSGDPVEVGGTNAISVRMSPASGALLTGENVEMTYTGPDRVEGPGQSVVDVVRAGDFEAQLTWAIGVDGEQPFKVSTLTGPTRIVVDVVAEG